MATVSPADLKIDNAVFYGSFIERIRDNVNVFNADSGGAITLGNSLIETGFFEEETFVKNITSLVDRRDVNSESDVDDSKFTEDSVNKFRLSRRAGPIAWSLSSLAIKNAYNSDAVSLFLGQWLADYSLKDMVSTALDCIITAIPKISGVSYNGVSGTVKLTTKNLTHVLQLRKDNFTAGNLWVMDSTSYYNLVRDQITTAGGSGIDSGENTLRMIRGGRPETMGIPTLVIERDDLQTIASNLRTEDKILLLNNGSSSMNQGPYRAANALITGKENLIRRWQVEYDLDSTVKGFLFSSTGTQNPTSAQLKTAGNWTFKYASPLDGPGYIGTYVKT